MSSSLSQPRARRSAELTWLFVVLVALVSSSVAAQPPADQRARAAEAYDRGVSAYLLRDYPTAARNFEQANRIAPSPVALAQAVRAYGLSGDERKAGSLALRLIQQEGLPANLREIAETAVARARTQFARVDVECSAACTLEVDGVAEEGTRFFVPPGRDVVVTASFGGGAAQSRTVRGRTGEVVPVAFEAPRRDEAVAVVASTDPHDLEVADEGDSDNPYRIDRNAVFSRPRAMFFTVLVPAVIADGMFVWSAFDMRRSRRHVERLVDRGVTGDQLLVARTNRDRDERRTKWFAFQGSLFLAGQIAIGIFTDWTPDWEEDGDEPAEGVTVEPTAFVAPGGGGGIGLNGRF